MVLIKVGAEGTKGTRLKMMTERQARDELTDLPKGRNSLNLYLSSRKGCIV